MYNYEDGSYSFGVENFTNEGLYQFESAYYIKYNSKKALYALSKISNGDDIKNVEEKCFYYHLYLDLLFQAVGMIINRFKVGNKIGNRACQVQNNCQQYNFNETEYPLLSDKSFRNFIEHIDERDEFLIDNNIYYGTFNLIYPQMDSKIKEGLLDLNKEQNNLLNIENMTYTILDYNRLKDKKTQINRKTIDLKKLELEIKKMNKISSSIWEYLIDSMFS